LKKKEKKQHFSKCCVSLQQGTMLNIVACSKFFSSLSPPFTNMQGPEIAILAIMSVPLSAIIGSYYYKIQKLKLQSKDGQGLPTEERQLLKQLMAQNLELKERVKNLETIAIEHDRAIEDQKALSKF
jgi:hypothetical protein